VHYNSNAIIADSHTSLTEGASIRIVSNRGQGDGAGGQRWGED
jgi:hypothetical protein